MEYSIAAFNGQRPDPVSGHCHLGNGYRAYNPILARFIAPDSWSPFGAGGINPYAYCAGDPVNRADPSGHLSPGQGIGMALGFIAGIALSILTEGAAMPVALTLMATVVGDAAIGAGAELAAEAIDGQRISGGQVGIAAGLSAMASLAGFALGRLSKLKGASNRPFGGLTLDAEFRFRASLGRSHAPGGNEPEMMSVVYDDTYVAAPGIQAGRTNIWAQMEEPERTGIGRLMLDGHETAPTQLAHALGNRQINIENNRLVRLVSSHSAAFAKRLASISGAIVTGFQGTVETGGAASASMRNFALYPLARENPAEGLVEFENLGHRYRDMLGPAIANNNNNEFFRVVAGNPVSFRRLPHGRVQRFFGDPPPEWLQ